MHAYALVGAALVFVIAMPALGQEALPLTGNSTPVVTTVEQPEAKNLLSSETDLLADLKRVNDQIVEAEKDLQQYDGGMIFNVIKSRIATLKLSGVMLEQRLLALRNGAKFDFSIPTAKPDVDRVNQIVEDLRKAREVLAENEREASQYAGGLIRAMALTTVATQRQTIALLEQAYFIAAYGMLPATAETTENVSTSESPNRSTLPEQADATSRPQPEDTTSLVEPNETTETEDVMLAAARAQGLDTVGNWVVMRGKSPVDDAPNYNAMAFDANETRSARDRKSFSVGCFENQTRLLYDPQEYLLSDNDFVGIIYRIDEEEAVRTRWSVSTTNKVTGVWGAKEGGKLLRSLLGKKKLFVQVTERNGKSHRAIFKLDGIEIVAAEVAKTCNWVLDPTASDPASTSSKSEGTRLQEALKEAGVYDGPIDGAIGPMTKAAIGRYQAKQQIPVTGEFDDATRNALGLQN